MMKRTALVLIAAGCLASFWPRPEEPAAPPGDPYHEMATFLDLNDIQETARRLDQKRLARDRFTALLAALLAKLEAGALSLDEATGQCVKLAQEHWPEYLFHLRRIGPGPTLRQSVARNLVLHFRVQIEEEPFGSETAELVQRLECELADLLSAAGEGIVGYRPRAPLPPATH